MRLKQINWPYLVLAIVIMEIIGGLSSLLAGNIAGIYAQLSKPPLAPPGIVFGIVWPLLYLLLGVYSYYAFYELDHDHGSHLRLLFITQIILNFLWCFIFFHFSAHWLGFIVILIMLVVLLELLFETKKVKNSLTYLIWPYLIWLLFATYLTVGVAILN
ncbi:sensory protein [Loigolactobacillus backii]|uniref:Sensory protein n=2 Tax=Loigolactobacillus backii TaxID=375175 RepID=A0A192H373_9LACO|nr:TspO/MBR family protein [Loigolactobacillus backii]ANK59274.1 sensory protein [Loigolactobacillus backii]ANK62687.1 sensory protein [Loigolactobacillus backii]ANK64266.1 sensory protein [Loigolactobacillus backii]ANK67340.1 sensory protein [Loigolactobacillus backii]ANK70305.1 sensory protein [Loigolactobacillus backii]